MLNPNGSDPHITSHSVVFPSFSPYRKTNIVNIIRNLASVNLGKRGKHEMERTDIWTIRSLNSGLLLRIQEIPDRRSVSISNLNKQLVPASNRVTEMLHQVGQ